MMRLLLAFCLLFALPGASACSCIFREEAGFIHANLNQLPANARGALFQLPYASRITLKATAFTIESDRHPQPLKAEISWPRLGTTAQHLLRERMLARVGPVGGFQPGARYTITYHGKVADWAYPTRTEFTIDTAALDVGDYQLQLTSGPVRRLVQLVDDGGMCASNQPAVVAEFSYVIPDRYAAYRSAMIYASETVDSAGKARLIAHSAMLCAPWTLVATANENGSDMVHASCERPGTAVAVRGRAGLLEVEDQLRTTNLLPVDFKAAIGRACTGYGMLKEAIAEADRERIADLVCALGAEAWRPNPPPPSAVPSFTTLLALGRARGAPPKECVYNASLRWIDDFQADPALLGPDLLEDLQSNDEARIARATQTLDYISRRLRHRAPPAPNGAVHSAALLQQILPQAVQLIAEGRSANASALAGLIGPMRPHIAPYLPALFDAGARRSVDAIPALEALAQLAPDDPRLHALLRQAAATPALLETAATLYDRVAPPDQAAAAIALLIEAARRGNNTAIYALGQRGRAASAAVPILAAQLRDSSPAAVRTNAYSSLIAVSNGEPEATAAFESALLHHQLPDFLLEELEKLGDKGRSLLPTLKRMLLPPLRSKLDTDQQRAVKRLIQGLQTPSAAPQP